MGLDIRLPIGIILTLYGLILAIYGAVAHPAIPESSLTLNIDMWWGAAMLAFGLFMGVLALRASRRKGV